MTERGWDFFFYKSIYLKCNLGKNDYYCSWACATCGTCIIGDDDGIVITGGKIRKGDDQVHKYTYNMKGQRTLLPSLNIGRYNHACGIVNLDGGKVNDGSR